MRSLTRLAAFVAGASLLALAAPAHAANGPDLVVSDATLAAAVPAIVAANTTVTVGGMVRNVGDSAAGASRLKYYFSRDALLDAGDTYLNYDSVPTLAAGAALAESANVRIPVGAADGAAYLLLIADHGAAVVETDEANNVLAIALTVGIPAPVVVPATGPDLQVTAASLSATQVDPGKVLTGAATIVNVGESAGANQLGYYLSKDATFDLTDTYLNYDAVDALGAGGTSPESASLKIPATTKAGMYSVLFVADRAKRVAEAREDNNVQGVRLAVGFVAPDLIVASANLGAVSIRPGEALPVTAVVQNLGEIPAAVTQLKYFLSTDATFDPSDKQVSFDKVDALAEFGASPEDAALRISAATPAGHWFVLFVADADGILLELSESNNVMALPVEVVTDDPTAAKPDLVATANLVLPSSAAPGAVVTASTVVQNIGVVAAGASRLKYFFSTDATLDAADRYLNFDNIPALEVGAPSPQNAAIPLPTDAAYGTAYILFVADHTEEVAERLESNNVVAVAITLVDPASVVVPSGPVDHPEAVLADLIVADATLDTPTVQAGERATLRCTIQNVGVAAASKASRVKYYLSRDDLFDASDKYLGLDTVDPLAVGASGPEDVTPTIPAATAQGIWFLVIVADAVGEVPERFESNNVFAVAFNVAVDRPDAALPDLRIDDLQADKATVAPNARVALRGTLANASALSAGGSRLKFYLSSDRRRDAADHFLAYRAIDPLVARETLPLDVSLRVPIATPAGPAFLLAVVDADAAVDESFESDDVVALAITVGPETAALPAMPYACSPALATDPGLLGLSTVATLNALHLGWDNKKDMPALACVVSHFDVVGLVEVDNEGGLQSLVQALQTLTGETWSYHVSEHEVGHDGSTEFYGFVWRAAAVQFTGALGFFDDPNDVIKREPYGANFKMGAFDFSLIVFHERYGDTMAIRRAEAAHLIEVYQYFQRVNGSEDDVLIGGDFNLAGDDDAFTVVGYDGVAYITDPEQKTSIGADGLASSFDNIFYSTEHTSELLFAGAYDYLNQNDAVLREIVSDHIPVWMAVDTSHDDD